MKPRIELLLCIAGVLAASAALAQSTVYRWVDKDGKVQFTDSPPPLDAKSVTEKRMGGGGEDSQMPFATQLAARRSPVTLYVANSCGEFCDQARALLNKRGVPFAEKNAEVSQADRDALVKAAGSASVPYLVVGEAGMAGFDEAAWNGALDRAGYARTRLPGQPTRPVPAPAPASAAKAEGK